MTQQKTVAVVDDYRDLVSVIKTSLEQKGFRVIPAFSAAELFDALEREKVDVIILDIMMPQMDGLQALGRLKNTPGTSSIPVILLTAKVQYQDMLEGYNAGADAYVTKPFTSSHLIDAINRVLGQPGKP